MSLFTLIAFAFLCAGAYYLCPHRFKWMLLLLVSYLYYAYCGMRALPFMLLTTLSTWAGALVIGSIGEKSKAELKARKSELDAAGKKALKAKAKKKQRIVFWAVLLLNFVVLGLVKYTSPVLELLGRRPLDLLLPLGISFYTFQSMGYLIDVANGKYAPEKNPARFALFISFFPQLIQGPIARHDQLAHQLTEPHRFDVCNIYRGALLILWGFFKKKVIADRALPLVSAVFDGHEPYGGAVIVVAVLFYSLQQYCDFSGGIDLVTGLAELFGIQLAPNFRRPYFSVSLSDFWRRWHISLGAWMRDYVFYPFALSAPVRRLTKFTGPRLGQAVSRTLPAALGNLLVFLLVGLWHGAALNYIVWGLYNGLVLAVSSLLEPVYKAWNEKHSALSASHSFHVLRILRTFIVVNIGWFFDRSAHPADAFRMISSLFARFSACALLIVFTVSLLSERGIDVRSKLVSLPYLLRLAFMLAACCSIVIFGVWGSGYDASAFIYNGF